MFGRLTRAVALGAMAAHFWVTMVFAPWHHLVEHRLPLTQPTAAKEVGATA